MDIREAAANTAFFAILLATIFAYWPGLSGPFLLDDFARIAALGTFGGVNHLHGLMLYLNEAWTGIAGRTLALISFLIDHNDWPAPARDFKYTNLLLHILNGCLLFSLVLRLLRLRGLSRGEVLGLSLFVTAAWLLHPLLVSTTLYAVQRMAILAATAVFAGLLGYVVAREGFDQRPRRALILMTLSLGIAAALGFLAKETAALILPLALVLESTLLLPTISHYRRIMQWRSIVLWLPTLVMAAYVTWRGIEGLGGFAHRDFGSLERLLTQSRIIWEYLYYWFIPQGTTPGLFNLDVELSTSLLSPPTTLLAALGVIVLAISAITLRHRYPLYAAGVGFFLVGHALESTALPLELYFEHRNYLAGALLWLPVGGACLALRYRPWAPPVLMVGILLILAPLTHFRASTWGDAKTLAMTATRENPDSHRAYRFAASTFHEAGHPVQALMVLRQASNRLPKNLPIAMHLAQQQCYVTGVRDETLETLQSASDTYIYRSNDLRQFEVFKETATNPHCSKLSPELLEDLIANLLENLSNREQNARERQQLHHLLGMISIEAGHVCDGYEEFRRSIDAYSAPYTIIRQAALLGESGLLNEARQHLRILDEWQRDSTDFLPSGSRPFTRQLLTEDISKQIQDRWEAVGRPNNQCTDVRTPPSVPAQATGNGTGWLLRPHHRYAAANASPARWE